jgi:hypothetical protein
MISDLTTSGSAPATVPHGKSDVVIAALNGLTSTVQPVRDVQAYLAARTPVPDCAEEKSLLITLPAKLQLEVKSLVRACKFVADLVREKWSVQSACKNALAVFDKWHWKLATFRQKYDTWAKTHDWVVLVNRAKAPAAWREGNAGLPAPFLAYCETKLARFARRDAKRQALLAIHRQWLTGKNEDGVREAIPGYGFSDGQTGTVPVGWSYDNVLSQIKRRARFTKATRALLHEGESAAREFLPHQLGSRRGLRFLEKITFDDVRLDWLVFDPITGQAVELWLLVARDEATAIVLGFVMHPATVNEAGKAAHLGARQMKELAAYLLQRYPLPPYLVHWLVERGTATLAEAVKAALAELFNNRIKVHYTSMIGGTSPTGYAEKRKGNSRGKASHEAHNRLFHTQGSFIGGQTGANWGIRPADLEARIRECQEIHERAQTLPEEKRAEVKYPLLTLAEAREKFAAICHEQNNRTEHALEDFGTVLEVQTATGWEVAEAAQPGVPCRSRMERPTERALRLIRSVDRWEKTSPDIVRTFLDHTQRFVTVNARGEIELMIEGRKLTYRAPETGPAGEMVPGLKCLAYHHPGDPEFLHLTSGDGRILGTWCQRGRSTFLDQQALAEAMRYTHAARSAAQAVAGEMAAPQREQLDAMREHNRQVAGAAFVVTSMVPDANGGSDPSRVAASLEAIDAAGEQMKVNPPAPVPVADCTEDLLKRAKNIPPVSEKHWD